MMGKNATTRGMSTPLSHVLSVGITTILIVGLMSGASGFLDDQSERTARQELNTIGTRLAGELDEADTLGRQADNVTLTSTHPDRVAGSTYTATLITNSTACADVPTQTCLQLSATEYDHEAVLAVNNETNLTLRETDSGTFRITSGGGSATPQAPTRSLDLSSRVGIGSEVGAGPPLGVGGNLAQRPIARFTFSPAEPSTGTTTTFDASLSRDPDGNITTYDWDWDNDNTYEIQGATASTQPKTFANAGRKNVTLRVTDNSGSNDTYSREFRVTGLEYGGTMAKTNGTRGVSFSITNQHTDPIEIERVLIDPATSSITRLREDTDDHEIEIGTEYVEYHYQRSIPPAGAIVDLDREGDVNTGNVVLNPSQSANVHFRYFNETTVAGKEFTFGFRYKVGAKYNAAVFNDTVTVP